MRFLRVPCTWLLASWVHYNIVVHRNGRIIPLVSTMVASNHWCRQWYRCTIDVDKDVINAIDVDNDIINSINVDKEVINSIDFDRSIIDSIDVDKCIIDSIDVNKCIIDSIDVNFSSCRSLNRILWQLFLWSTLKIYLYLNLIALTLLFIPY